MKTRITIALQALCVLANMGMAADDLAKAFTSPPHSAKPRAYWFHMSGNITKTGITADLEAMKEIGLAGTLFMNVSVALPTGLVETKDFMSPAWQECFQHMLNESARLGLDFGSALCDGWGNAGGPQIPPELAMQRLTWSETRVRGGETVEIAKLPQPQSLLDYYRDVAVIAFPTPDSDRAPVVCSKKGIALKRPAAGGVELRFDLDAPATVRELTLLKVDGLAVFGNPIATIEASDDAKTWRVVKKLPCSWRGKPTELTIAFEPVTARHFRLLLPPESYFRTGQIRIGEALLANRDRIHLWQPKTAIVAHPEHGGGAERYLDTGATDAPGIAPSSIVVLNGKAKWVAPEGDWTVLRIGHTPTGAHNAPATKAGVGLECDKFNPRGVEAQHEAFVDKVLATATPAGKHAFKYTWIDSWEVGIQNWTAKFPAEFRARRGYDITPWLPVLAGGRIVGSRDKSERFLWDFRRTIADLLVDNYWKRSMELAHKRGIEFRAESFGRQQFMYDPMNFARANDMPCGEFWVGGGPRVDCKVAASAAHLSGRQIAGAEAFTAGRGQWLDDPWSLKTLGDRAFCLGVNQYYFHRYAHQPWLHLVPGMTFGPYGINFERTSTWWRPGKAWVEYLTRCQSLLQQGRFVADALVMLDEGAPSYGGWKHELAIPLPAGYDYDFANLDALRESRVERGVIVHKNGMRYRLLMLPATGRATPALTREVLRLAEAGAKVATPREFTRAQGMTSDETIAALWKKITATGNVIVSRSFDSVERKLGLTPDFAHDRDAEMLWIHRTDDAGADWYFVSNQSDGAFDALCTFRITGRQPELWDAATGRMRDVARFEERGGRTTVQIPFDPRGSWFVVFSKPASALSADEIALRATSSAVAAPRRELWIENGKLIEETEQPAAMSLNDEWDVTFQRNRGAPASVRLGRLMDLSRHADEGIRHFSGTLIYRRTFESKIQNPKSRILLDLGEVQNLAEVILNGRNLGVLWKQPFRLDITSALKDGANKLEIRVTNLWVNRLIGDAKKMAALGVAYANRSGVISKWPVWVPQDAPPADAPVTFTTWRQWDGTEALQPSGLLGPVMMRALEHVIAGSK
ncbi:MAG: glycosyl hydrolase [Verrucomicrobiia bacterium]